MVEVEVAATDQLGILLGPPQRTTVLVDSGADYTMLDDRLPSVLGIPPSVGRPITLEGIANNEVVGRLILVKIGLCGVSIDAPVMFCYRPDPPLLGRAGVFEQIAFSFRHGQNQLLAVTA
jgi:hypothetical protein